MKILKPGVLPTEQLFRGTSSTCGCQVECSRDETRTQDDGRNGVDYYITCPTPSCQRHLWVTHVKEKQ